MGLKTVGAETIQTFFLRSALDEVERRKRKSATASDGLRRPVTVERRPVTVERRPVTVERRPVTVERRPSDGGATA